MKPLDIIFATLAGVFILVFSCYITSNIAGSRIQHSCDLFGKFESIDTSSGELYVCHKEGK